MFRDLPTEIHEISAMKEKNKTRKITAQALTTIDPGQNDSEFLKYVTPVEFSVTKENIYHWDENRDINYIKDLSSFSRNVFQDKPSEEMDALTLELLDPEFHDFENTFKSPSDEMCLNIASNKIPDQMLHSLIKDPSMYKLRRNFGDPDQNDYQENSAHKLSGFDLQEKRDPTDSNNKKIHIFDSVVEEGVPSVSIDVILKNIVNFKHLKDP
jgi:hypothetical protein